MNPLCDSIIRSEKITSAHAFERRWQSEEFCIYRGPCSPQPATSLVQLPRLITFAVVPRISRWKSTGGSEVFDTLCDPNTFSDPHNSWPWEVVHHRHEGLEFKGTKVPTHSLAPLSGPRAVARIEIRALGRGPGLPTELNGLGERHILSMTVLLTSTQ
jgi:hypothetical protein